MLAGQDSARGHDRADLDRLGSRRPSLAARFIAGALTPALVVSALTRFVAIRHSPGWSAGVGWACATVLLVVGAPYLVLFRALHLGVVDDRQVVRRSQRPALMAAALGCVAAALALLVVVGAPRALVVLVLAQAGGLAAMTAVTLRWKASMHLAVAAGAVAIAAMEVPVCAMTALLLPLLGWARWRDGRHSLAQLAGGAAVGASTAVAIYGALR